MKIFKELAIGMMIFLIALGLIGMFLRIGYIQNNVELLTNNMYEDYNSNRIYPGDSLINIAMRKYWTNETEIVTLLVKTEKGGAEWKFESLAELKEWINGMDLK